MKAQSFIEIPVFHDIAQNIFSNLDIQDLLNCRLVCKTFNNLLMNDHKLWKNLLESYAKTFTNLTPLNPGWKEISEKIENDGDIFEIIQISEVFSTLIKDGSRHYMNEEFPWLYILEKFENIHHLKIFNKYKLVKASDVKIWKIFRKRFRPAIMKLYSYKKLSCIGKRLFDLLIDETLKLPCNLSRETYLVILSHSIISKDVYRIKRTLELHGMIKSIDSKEITEQMAWKMGFCAEKSEAVLLQVFLTANIEIFKLITSHLQIDFDIMVDEDRQTSALAMEGIFEHLGDFAEDVLENYCTEKIFKIFYGIYPLHIAAMIGSQEIFMYIYSQVKEKRPKLTGFDMDILPYHLAKGDFRKELEKLYQIPDQTEDEIQFELKVLKQIGVLE